MAQYDFDGRVAFVTGAARGQGRSHALRYAENGADVVATDICETGDASPYELSGSEELRETVEGVEARGQEGLAVEMDVSEEGEVENAVGEALDAFGRIDVLANNAGVAPVELLMELDEETWDLALDVNLKGMWLCAKHVGNHMIERGEGGAIVNTASTAGFFAAAGQGHYTAAKHGVLGLTKSLALELAPHDVRANAVCPTSVETPMTDGVVESIDEDVAALAEASGPTSLLGDVVQPEDVSAAVMWLSSDDARFVTGIGLPIDGGASAV